MRQRRAPNQADRRPVCDSRCWHAQRAGSTSGPAWAQAVPACSVDRRSLLQQGAATRGSTMLSWEKSTPFRAGSCSSPTASGRALLDQQARQIGRPVRDRRVARLLGVGARLLPQGRREALSVRPAAGRGGGASRHPLGGSRAGEHRAAVGPLGRPAGQARPQGHAPDRALVPHRRRAHRHRGLPRARIRRPHRQSPTASW